MSDVIDRAQDVEIFSRDLALRAVRSGAHQLSTPADFGLCNTCAEPIDAERRKAAPGAFRCLFCQEAAERRRRTHRVT